MPIILTTKPGQPVSTELRVKNASNQTETLKVSLFKFSVDDQGQVKLFPQAKLSESAEKLLNKLHERREDLDEIRQLEDVELAKRISLMLTREFLRWVFFGNVIAVPIAYWFAQRWLSGYAYRIRLDGRPFILALIVTLGVALLTVGRQTYKTGRLDPARCIKHE